MRTPPDEPDPRRPSWRELAKALARGAAAVVVAPLLLTFRVNSRLVGKDRAIQGATQVLALAPGLTGQYLRRAFLSRALASCHVSATVEFGTTFSKAGTVLGANVYIGPMCHIGLAHIGREALLGAGVHVLSGPATHGIADPSLPPREQPGVVSLVRIGECAWVGSAAVIMADVGREAVVGAGAVVTRAVPPRVIAAGVPARVLRPRYECLETANERPTAGPVLTREVVAHDRPASAP